MTKLLVNGIINEDNVAILRNSYTENIKWQIENYEAVESWISSKIKFDKNEKIEYLKCKDRNIWNGWKKKGKKRRNVEV